MVDVIAGGGPLRYALIASGTIPEGENRMFDSTLMEMPIGASCNIAKSGVAVSPAATGHLQITMNAMP
jgi:hypothetical protein